MENTNNTDKSTFNSKNSSINEPVAIIGMGCRFPGAKDLKAYWELLSNGIDAIREVPKDRWDIDKYYDPDFSKPGKMNTFWGGFLDEIDKFDPYFFGIIPREAHYMDPQQRILLEVVWEALEDAGLVVEALRGTDTGVFMGMMNDDYRLLQLSNPEGCDPFTPTGIVLCVAPNRVSHLLDFRGPSLAVDNACSSSLVSIHLACQSLWTGETSLAIAGGINLIASPAFTIGCAKIGVLSPDGRCKVFDSRANGFIRGEGCGVVVLKLLSQAIADGDSIYAVVRSTAVGHDGGTSPFKTPSQKSQEELMLRACKLAGIAPSTIQYIEAHGTGTPVGDPIEFSAITNVLSIDRSKGDYCSVGSVKTNFGHTEAAAGIAGVIKTALAIKNKLIPKSLHFEKPNPRIDLTQTPLKVQTSLGPWPNNNKPLIAGINSFGLSGTIAHVILSEPNKDLIQITQTAKVTQADKAIDSDSTTNKEKSYLLPISAKNQTALQDFAKEYIEFFSKQPDSLPQIKDICYTASLRRQHHEYRLAMVANSAAGFLDQLEAFIKGETRLTMASGSQQTSPTKLVFVYPGTGSQWFGMGQDLLKQEAVFREQIELCDQFINKEMGWSLIEQLTDDKYKSQLNEIDIVQPIIFAIQVGLSALWRSWGIEPDAVVGQSMGEIAAAHFTGILTLEQAVEVVCRRSRLLKKIRGQGMMVIAELSFSEAQKAIQGYEDRVCIAICNSPRLTVLSGQPQAVKEIMHSLLRQYIFCRPINSEVATHSPETKHLAELLVNEIDHIEPKASNTAIYSTLTGERIDGAKFNAKYWADTLSNTVLFSQAIEKLFEDGYSTFLEISPEPILLGAIQQGFPNKTSTLLASMRKEKDSRTICLSSLATLYTFGYPLNWSKLFSSRSLPVSLPNYPWQKEQFWIPTANLNNKNLQVTKENTAEKNELVQEASQVLIKLLKYLDVDLNISNLDKLVGLIKTSQTDKLPKESAQTAQTTLTTETASNLAVTQTTSNGSNNNGSEHTRESVEKYIREQLAKVAGFSPVKINVNQPVNKLGLDSLLMLSVKNQIEGHLKVTLPITSFLRGDNILQMADLLYEQIKAAAATTKSQHSKESVEKYIREQLAKVAGFSPAKINVNQPVNKLGLDSLLMLSVKNQIEGHLKVTLPITSFLRGDNILQMTDLLYEQIKNSTNGSNVVENQTKPETQATLSLSSNDWIIRHRPNKEATMRIFCLPYAGKGASIFRSWPDYFPTSVELCAIELPGRETRIGEPLFSEIKPLVKAMLKAIEGNLDLPFALFGHSLGSLIFFELARELRRTNKPTPVHFFSSSFYHPRIKPVEVHKFSESEFIDYVQTVFGTLPEAILKDPELKKVFLSIIRADGSLYSTYVYQEEEAFNFPITAFLGTEDHMIKIEDMLDWGQYTKTQFNLKKVPGNHFFIEDPTSCKETIEEIKKALGI